jgi:phage terminase large subunit-like protein
MNAPMKEFERAVMAHKVRHGNNPVLRWMASNLMAEMDPAGNIKPSKAKSGDKIDGIVALIMAIGCTMVATEEAHSMFEDETRTVFM